MEMKIDASVVRALRTKKLWSQEELATACGVSLRTVQRVESSGRVSAETLKALAGAFNVNHDYLKATEKNSRGYYNIQLGYALIAVFLFVAGCLVWALIEERLNSSVFVVLNLFIAVICTLFATLTTKVSESTVEWHFTFGFLRKSIAIENIQSNSIVRNKAWWGLGIRLIPDGWLYCISGLDAVSLHLDDGRIYRVGTDEPKELNEAIELARLRNAGVQ